MTEVLAEKPSLKQVETPFSRQLCKITTCTLSDRSIRYYRKPRIYSKTSFCDLILSEMSLGSEGLQFISYDREKNWESTWLLNGVSLADVIKRTIVFHFIFCLTYYLDLEKLSCSSSEFSSFWDKLSPVLAISLGI